MGVHVWTFMSCSDHIGDISSYNGSYMCNHIWVHIYGCPYMCNHIWVHIYGCPYMGVRICANIYVLVSYFWVLYPIWWCCKHGVTVYLTSAVWQPGAKNVRCRDPKFVHRIFRSLMFIYGRSYVYPYMITHIWVHIWTSIYVYSYTHICVHIYEHNCG